MATLYKREQLLAILDTFSKDQLNAFSALHKAAGDSTVSKESREVFYKALIMVIGYEETRIAPHAYGFFEEVIKSVLKGRKAKAKNSCSKS